MGSIFFGVAENNRSAAFIISEVTVVYANPSSRVFVRPMSNTAAPAAAAAPPRIVSAGRLKAALVVAVANGVRLGRSIIFFAATRAFEVECMMAMVTNDDDDGDGSWHWK